MSRKLFVYVCMISTMIFLCICPSFGAAINDFQNKKNNIDQAIDSLQKEKQEEKNKLDDRVENKDKLAKDQQKEKEKYQDLISQKSAKEKEIKSMEDSLKKIEENYDNQEELFKKRLRVMYENSSNSYIKAIAESKDITDLMERIEMILLISKRDKEIIQSLSNARKDAEYKKEKKQLQKLEVQDKMSGVLGKIKNMEESKTNLDKEIGNIILKLDEIEKQEDELLKKSEELENNIRRLQAKKSKYTGGVMLWPVPSCMSISSYFGLRDHPVLKVDKMHTGIDIPASMGVSVVAANKGTVIIADWQGGYGYTVVIDHGGGITTLYGHNSKLLVNVGDKVDVGTTISKVGSTGISTGPHVHFEIRNNGAPVDPLQYVSP